MEPVDARHLTEQPEDGRLIVADKTELPEEAPGNCGDLGFELVPLLGLLALSLWAWGKTRAWGRFSDMAELLGQGLDQEVNFQTTCQEVEEQDSRSEWIKGSTVFWRVLGAREVYALPSQASSTTSRDTCPSSFEVPVDLR
jgi:hypothetical protein